MYVNKHLDLFIYSFIDVSFISLPNTFAFVCYILEIIIVKFLTATLLGTPGPDPSELLEFLMAQIEKGAANFPQRFQFTLA